MLDLSKPVQTRDGRKVRIFATDFKKLARPIIGAVDEGAYEVPYTWHADGTFNKQVVASQLDLRNVPVRRTGWMNVYGYAGNETMNGVIHPTREKAEQEALEGRLACIKVTFDEGHGL